MSDHGTFSRYCNGGCRCAECREANRLYHKAYWDRKHAASEALVSLRDAARLLVNEIDSLDVVPKPNTAESLAFAFARRVFEEASDALGDGG